MSTESDKKSFVYSKWLILIDLLTTAISRIPAWTSVGSLMSDVGKYGNILKTQKVQAP